jgi:hypothetical protein
MTMNLSENVSPSRLELIKQLRRRGMLARQMDITPQMMTKLLGRNTLTRKLLLELGIDESVFQTRKNALQIADSIDRRVDRTKVQEVVLLPISLDELHDYLRIGRGKRDRGEPLVTLLQQFPPISFFTTGKRKCQLQQQLLDNLKRILREKTAEIFQLERIRFATSNSFQLMQWGKQQGDAWRMQGTPLAERWNTIKEDKELAERFAEEELTILRQQCQELRTRINELEEKIKNRSEETSCPISGGKTKSKHTKSKHTKSKHTKSKYTKSKKSKKSKRRN